MKRKCKNVDITDLEFIKTAINKCMANKVKTKGKKIYRRDDIKRYFEEHDNDVNKIAMELQAEMKARKLNLTSVSYKNVLDRCSGKPRRLCIEDIKQQFYDYIATMALDDLSSYIGVNQTACQYGKGQQYSARLVSKWLKHEKISYCAKADIKKCYQSITHENMMSWLQKHVKNEQLLWLIGELLSTCEEGLPIGSYMSITLCALYVADIYHSIENDYCYAKRGKSINPVSKVLIYLDDIYIFGSNATQIKKVMRGTIDYAKDMGLTIKDNWQLISLRKSDADAHIDIVGYKVYRDRVTARRSNYLKLRKSVRDFKRHKSCKLARTLIARLGIFLKFTSSQRFVKKYRTRKLLKLARRKVAFYDKSKIRRTTAAGSKGWQLLPD